MADRTIRAMAVIFGGGGVLAIAASAISGAKGPLVSMIAAVMILIGLLCTHVFFRREAGGPIIGTARQCLGESAKRPQNLGTAQSDDLAKDIRKAVLSGEALLRKYQINGEALTRYCIRFVHTHKISESDYLRLVGEPSDLSIYSPSAHLLGGKGDQPLNVSSGVQDIVRAGLSLEQLLTNYDATEKQLIAYCKHLAGWGYISEQDFERVTGRPFV